MSERIDHAAKAQEHIAWAKSAPNGTSPDWPTAMLGNAQIAQAEATLALVEQQRIANLIALSQATSADGSRIAPWAITHPVGDYSVGLNDDIKKGLGL